MFGSEGSWNNVEMLQLQCKCLERIHYKIEKSNLLKCDGLRKNIVLNKKEFNDV